jgi:RNA polymerase sigma-70 factor (ECF subfamily)
MLGDAVTRVVAAMSHLPEQQREIIVLRVAVGMSSDETAAALGMTPGAVRVAQHRALATLRRLTATTPLSRGGVA